MALVRAADLIRGPRQPSQNIGRLPLRAVGESTAAAAVPLGFFLLVAAAGIALVLASPPPKRRRR
jgi:hypothetical protein